MSDSNPQNPADSSRYAKSSAAFARAKRVMPGGVNSPVRAYKSVGRDPIFVDHGKGAMVTDVDGNDYIDYVGSFGPLILGHAFEPVVEAVRSAAAGGTSFGMPSQRETQLAEMVIDAVPSVEVVRFVNSGTEAVMSAIRLARAATGRAKVVKMTGGYHGHSDSLLVQAGSGAMTLGVPSSPGVPEAITSHTLLIPYNDLQAAEQVFAQHGKDIACIVVEPIAGNMGCIPPSTGYLQGLQDICTKHDSVLLFDEVMTGFRVGYSCAQGLYGVTPDLTCLGKVVGGGLPCAAYGGREDLMRQVAPDGPMYQAGTLSGNPIAMAAGIAMLDALKDGTVYSLLETLSDRLMEGVATAASAAGVKVSCTRVGSMVCCFFSEEAPTNYEEASQCDTEAFTHFFGSMLDQGVVLPPSQYETWFVSAAHDDDSCIDRTIESAKTAFKTM